MRWRRRKEEAAGAELKTKTPHKDVGKKMFQTTNQQFVMKIQMVFSHGKPPFSHGKTIDDSDDVPKQMISSSKREK